MDHNLKIFTDNIEPLAVNQIYNLIVTPAFYGSKVRIMPDVHIGSGCVVGFTATLSDKVIPNVIGVDIGCGMLTVNLGKNEIDYKAVDDFIRASIPAGSDLNKDYDDLDYVKSLVCFDELNDKDRIYRSLGTLGGGNHFIEIDKDDDGNAYLIIHTGSRNFGLQVAKLYQQKAITACKVTAPEKYESAKEFVNKIGKCGRAPDSIMYSLAENGLRSKVPPEFCYFLGDECEPYLHDMRLCQRFASDNRAKIAEKILKFLGVRKAESFETMHNYIDDDGIIRKGAISAREGERVIIPMNMRDGCLIAIGKGNSDWNFSAPHGAGRLVGRGEARELFTQEEYEKSMEGIYTTSVNESTIDESPMAYKPMEEIVKLVSPTVEIEKIIRPVYNFKASKK